MVFHHVHPNPNQITVLVVSASTFFIMYNPTQTTKPNYSACSKCQHVFHHIHPTSNQTKTNYCACSQCQQVFHHVQPEPDQTTVLVVCSSTFFIITPQNKPNYCNCSQCQQVFNHVQPKPNYCACSQLQHVFHVKPNQITAPVVCTSRFFIGYG